MTGQGWAHATADGVTLTRVNRRWRPPLGPGDRPSGEYVPKWWWSRTWQATWPHPFTGDPQHARARTRERVLARARSRRQRQRANDGGW